MCRGAAQLLSDYDMDRLSVGSVQVIIRVKSNQAEQGIGGWWGGGVMGWLGGGALGGG